MAAQPEVTRVVDLLNQRLNGHARGRIRPEDIEKNSNANCFGKMAIAGAALVARGIEQSELSLLVCTNHGLEYKERHYWYGHAALLISGDAPILLDAATTISITDPQITPTWRKGQDRPEVAIDLKRKPQVPNEPIDWLALRGLEDLVGPVQISSRQHIFNVFSLHEGIAAYQVQHPELASRPPVQPVEYLELYDSLQRTEMENHHRLVGGMMSDIL